MSQEGITQGLTLAQALRFAGGGRVFPDPPRLAFVGAGGKTTALIALGRELTEGAYRAALLTTTTHLGDWQAELADHHMRIDEDSDLPSSLPDGVTLFTGREVKGGRFGALPGRALARLYELAEERQAPLLIEADGSRLRPLKAPAEHEPVLAEFVDGVVVVAGLTGLGKPLSAEWVHRPERFAVLAGLNEGESITPQALARVLTHPLGGLKGIPPGARRILLLNQADTSELQGAGLRIAEMCLSAYQAGIVASLRPQNAPTASPQVFSVHEPVAIILMAAGESRRFGQPKQLLDWQGQPLVRHVAQIALAAGCERVRVVVGAFQEQVRAALEGLPVEIVANPAWQEGQAASVRAGISELPPETGAALFLLVDQPQVPPCLLRALIDLHARTLLPLVAPLCQGRRANPVLFDRLTFPDLLTLQGDVGGRALFASERGYPVAWLPWEDERLLWDLDTEEDYRRMLEDL